MALREYYYQKYPKEPPSAHEKRKAEDVLSDAPATKKAKSNGQGSRVLDNPAAPLIAGSKIKSNEPVAPLTLDAPNSTQSGCGKQEIRRTVKSTNHPTGQAPYIHPVASSGESLMKAATLSLPRSLIMRLKIRRDLIDGTSRYAKFFHHTQIPT